MAKKRNTPLYVVDGTVKIYAPTSLEGKSKYFRVVYLCDGMQKDTTAKTEALAKSIAGKIARGLKHGGAFKFQLSGSELINAYLDPAVREVSGRAWGPKHSLAQRSLLNMYVRPVIGNLACSEITNDLIKKIVKDARTVSIGQHLSSSLHGLINWGHQENWTTERPEELLKGLTNTVNKIKGLKKAVESGENFLFIHTNEIPSHADVDAVAKAAASISGIWWYELLFNLAAYSGMRIGAIFDLDLSQIDLKTKTIRIGNQCLEAGGKKARTLPKYGKRRTTIYPTTTPSGYPLAKELKRRIKELELLEAPKLLDGTYRHLLFHNKRGSWISQSWFATKIRRPAQHAAGWLTDEEGQYIWTFHSLRHVFCSYYLGATDLGRAI